MTLQSLRQRWNSYWYSPQHPYDICVARPWFYLLLLYFLGGPSDFRQWAMLPADALWVPISFFKWLPLMPVSPSTAATLGLIWRACVVLSALGLFTRLATMVVFLLGLYIFGLMQCFGKIDHVFHLPVFIAGVFAFSRCGDFFSLDWLLWRRRRGIVPKPRDVYRWPLMLARTYMCVIYFEAGFQKWRASGPLWAFSDNLQIMLLTRPTVTSYGLWLASHPWLCRFLATFMLFAQTSAPLALLDWRLAIVLVPVLFSFHIGTYTFMGNHGYFLPYDIAYVVWVPWALLLAKLYPERQASVHQESHALMHAVPGL